jgi:sulfite reductase alpha subunit
LLGTTTDQLQPTFDDLAEIGFDLGGSGSSMRTPSCCVGPARCEWACFDSLNVVDTVTRKYQDQLHRPMFPYKFKIKISACPNDCVASIARSDLSVIGTWKGNIPVDQAEVRAYAANGMDIQTEIVDMCPTKCMAWSGDTLTINDKECNRCMHCINIMPKALRPGPERGASILVGGKAPIVHGAMLGWVVVPFIKLEPPYENLTELIDKIFEWWDENGKMRERLGELINRQGMGKFLKAIGQKPMPQMIKRPRANPYYFWREGVN